MSAGNGAKIRVLAPVVRGRKGEYSKQIDGYRKSGYSRLIVDGSEYNILDEEVSLDIIIIFLSIYYILLRNRASLVYLFLSLVYFPFCPYRIRLAV